MYENDLIVRNSRPPGANSIETRLLICVFTRDYQFELRGKPDLPFIPYIIERFTTMFKPPDPKAFETLIQLEIANSQKLSFITPTGDLTARGIVFIELSLNGSYGYTMTKFDNVMGVYMTALSMLETIPQIPHEICQECYLQEPEEPAAVEQDPETLTVTIPSKEFIRLVQKYNLGSFWSRVKGLFGGK